MWCWYHFPLAPHKFGEGYLSQDRLIGAASESQALWTDRRAL